MYPETMANDNPGWGGSPPPRHGIHKVNAKPARTDHRRSLTRRLGRAAFYLMLAVFFNCEAVAADKLRLAVQKTGTFGWELAIISAGDSTRKSASTLKLPNLPLPKPRKSLFWAGRPTSSSATGCGSRGKEIWAAGLSSFPIRRRLVPSWSNRHRPSRTLSG